jgi:membrane protease YdiL (CAAX protease family)
MSTTSQRPNGFAMAILVEGGLGLVAVGLAWLFTIPLREQIIKPAADLASAALRGVEATILMLLVFFGLMHSSRPALRRLREQVETLVAEMFPSASLAQFALVAALAGVGEELLFRGVVQTLIGRWTTPVFGLIAASVLFGFAHALSKLYFIFATLVGLCFGWLMLAFNDLVAPIVAHSFYDFIALAYIARSAGRVTQRSPVVESTAAEDNRDSYDDQSND